MKRAGARAQRATTRRARRSTPPRSTRSRRATAACCRRCSTASRAQYAEASARGGARLRGSPARARATSCASDAEIREREQLRFRSIMVDEFQDTNRLQCELLDLLAGGPDGGALLRRRRVPVDLRLPARRRRGLPRAARAAAETVLPLTRNYRSRPEVLAAVNDLFARGVRRRVPAARSLPPSSPRPASSSHPSSCSSPTRRATRGTGVHWRRAEARHVARRVRELVDAGVATPGRDRPPLRGRHRRRVVRGGAARARPADLPGDGSQLLRPAAGRRPPRLPAAAPQPLRRRGAAHGARVAVRRRLERRARADPRRDAPTRSRSSAGSSARCRATCRRGQAAPARASGSATTGSSTLRRARAAGAALRADPRRARLRPRRARARTTAGGATRTCASSRASRAPTKSCAAPTSRASSASSRARRRSARRSRTRSSEEEGGDAVRLLTIHAAKGLEFKVVVVADAGRVRPPVSRHPRALRRPVRLQGRRTRRPATRVGTASYQDVKGERERAEQAERLRLYYVAMTRAMERLIVSGSIGPATTTAEETPIAWVLGRLGLEDEVRERAAEEPYEIERGGAARAAADRPWAAGARARRRQATDAEPEPEAGSWRCSTAQASSCRSRRRGSARSPRSPSRRSIASRGSRSARISLFERCSYRYYAERVAGMRPAPWTVGEGDGGLHATELGDAVHRLLERVDLGRPAPARGPRGARPRLVSDGRPTRARADSSDGRRLLRLRARAPDRGARRRRARAAVRLPARGRPSERPPRRALARRRARACPRLQDERSRRSRRPRRSSSTSTAASGGLCARVHARGRKRGRGRLPVPRGPEDVVSTTFTDADVAALEAELGAAVARIREGDFRPTPSEFACSGCPALDRRLRRAASRLGARRAPLPELTAAG